MDKKRMTSKTFENVVLFSMAEIGAMGLPATIMCVRKNGDRFLVYYECAEEYSEIKKFFPALSGCYWNGPMEGEKTDSEIIVFIKDDESNAKSTRVSEGWRHIYMGAGNHLMVKDEYYSIFSKHIQDLTCPVDIFGSWQERVDRFIEEINQ